MIARTWSDVVDVAGAMAIYSFVARNSLTVQLASSRRSWRRPSPCPHCTLVMVRCCDGVVAEMAVFRVYPAEFAFVGRLGTGACVHGRCATGWTELWQDIRV